MERMDIGLGELKFAGDGAAMSFEGYGAVFGNVDSYGDVIEPGAFAATLADARKSGRWPAMLAQHGGMALTADDMMPIGVWTDMAEDGKGLYVQGVLADTQRGRDAYTLMKMQPRAAINGLSIGYVAREFEMGTKPGAPRRRLKSVDLMEVSLVTFPANPKARVAAVKSSGGLTERDAERALRDAGFSRSEAKAIVAAGFKTIAPREAADDAQLAALQALLSRIPR